MHNISVSFICRILLRLPNYRIFDQLGGLFARQSREILTPRVRIWLRSNLRSYYTVRWLHVTVLPYDAIRAHDKYSVSRLGYRICYMMETRYKPIKHRHCIPSCIVSCVMLHPVYCTCHAKNSTMNYWMKSMSWHCMQLYKEYAECTRIVQPRFSPMFSTWCDWSKNRQVHKNCAAWWYATCLNILSPCHICAHAYR